MKGSAMPKSASTTNGSTVTQIRLGSNWNFGKIFFKYKCIDSMLPHPDWSTLKNRHSAPPVVWCVWCAQIGASGDFFQHHNFFFLDVITKKRPNRVIAHFLFHKIQCITNLMILDTNLLPFCPQTALPRPNWWYICGCDGYDVNTPHLIEEHAYLTSSVSSVYSMDSTRS